MPEEILTPVLGDIANARTIAELETIRIGALGKKGRLTALLKNLSSIEPEHRKTRGKKVNEAKRRILQEIEFKRQELEEQRFLEQIQQEQIDVSLPGSGAEFGSLHPVTQTMRIIADIFANSGFTIAEGPEIESDFYNFEALNIPEDHPARAMHDTFYFPDGRLLRTHSSPVQIREMEKCRPPLSIIAPGRVYRRDSDVTHTPMFHQVEGLVVAENVTFANLKFLLHDFLQVFFGDKNIKVKFRPSYFPFTEPSAEVDIGCVMCGGKGCRVCSHTGWIEVLGSGMVHPNVFNSAGIDHKKYTGLAFGLGVERLAMLKYGINDLRMFFDNDLRFLKQF